MIVQYDAYHVPTYLRTGGLADHAKPYAHARATFLVLSGRRFHMSEM